MLSHGLALQPTHTQGYITIGFKVKFTSSNTYSHMHHMHARTLTVTSCHVTMSDTHTCAHMLSHACTRAS
jgi:hypothetical protein